MKHISKFKKLKIFHAALVVVWGVSVFLTLERKYQDCYNRLLGMYVGYPVFKWFQIFFVFGGGWLLLALFLLFLYEYLAYMLFELLFILIILVNFIVYFGCQ